MRRKHNKRLPARKKEQLSYPVGPNIHWSMDLVHDGLASGRPFRSYKVLDDFNREALNITIDTCLSSRRVIRELDNLIDWMGKPERIRVDNGPEFVANTMRDWAERREIYLVFIQKGKPYQNGLVERFTKTGWRVPEELLISIASSISAIKLDRSFPWVEFRKNKVKLHQAYK